MSIPIKEQNNATTSSKAAAAAEDSGNSKAQAQQQLPKVSRKRGAGVTMGSRRKRDTGCSSWLNIDGTVAKYNFETGKAKDPSGSESTRGSGRGRGHNSVNRRGSGNGNRGPHVKEAGQQSNASLKIRGSMYVGQLKREIGQNSYSNKLSSWGSQKSSASSLGGHTLSLSRLIKGSSPVRPKYNERSSTSSAPVHSPWTSHLAQFLNSGSNCPDIDKLSMAQRVVSEEAQKQAENSLGWFIPTNSFLNPIIPVFPRIQQNLQINEPKDYSSAITTTKGIENTKMGSEIPFLNFCENYKKPSYIPFIEDDSDEDDSG